MLDILITNATFPSEDFKGTVSGSIGIKDGKITYLGEESFPSAKTIDAKGLFVSPGFIDIHMHEEKLEGNDPWDISHSMVKMGVTTAVGGNCGLMFEEPKSFEEYISKNGAPINYMLLLGYNDIRKKYVPDKFDEASPEDLQKIHDEIRNYLDSDLVIGLSFGLTYSPGITPEELVQAARLLNDNQMLAAHYRADSVDAIDSVNELISVSKETGAKVQISHIGSCAAFGMMGDVLNIIRNARKDGVRIGVDCYPYDAWSSMIGIPGLADSSFEKWNKGFDSIRLMEEPYRGVVTDEALFRKVREEYPDMLVVASVMNEDEVIMAMKDEDMILASDGLLNAGQGHPRAAGTFPRILGKYVREENQLELLDALKKMTLLPAKQLNLSKKGKIKLGYDADLTLFDPETVIDQADYLSNKDEPQGIEAVIINGKIAYKDGQENLVGAFIKSEDR